MNEEINIDVITHLSMSSPSWGGGGGGGVGSVPGQKIKIIRNKIMVYFSSTI